MRFSRDPFQILGNQLLEEFDFCLIFFSSESPSEIRRLELNNQTWWEESRIISNGIILNRRFEVSEQRELSKSIKEVARVEYIQVLELYVYLPSISVAVATLMISIQQIRTAEEGAISVEWRRGRYITQTKSAVHLIGLIQTNSNQLMITSHGENYKKNRQINHKAPRYIYIDINTSIDR